MSTITFWLWSEVHRCLLNEWGEVYINCIFNSARGLGIHRVSYSALPSTLHEQGSWLTVTWSFLCHWLQTSIYSDQNLDMSWGGMRSFNSVSRFRQDSRAGRSPVAWLPKRPRLGKYQSVKSVPQTPQTPSGHQPGAEIRAHRLLEAIQLL